MPRSAGVNIGNFRPPRRVVYGASYIQPPHDAKYIRRFDSLFHYPAWDKKRRCTLDWMSDNPSSGYEGAKQFGKYTIELTGIPYGFTNQAIEEKLRRFFSKFGYIERCRSVPHERDPFQSSGVAYIAFKSSIAAEKAMSAKLKMSNTFGNRIIYSRYLNTDVVQDHKWYKRELHACNQSIAIARELYTLLENYPTGLKIHKIPKLLTERKFEGTALVAAGQSIIRVFGSWPEFFDAPQIRQIFILRSGNYLPSIETIADKNNTSIKNSSVRHMLSSVGDMVQQGQWVRCWGANESNSTSSTLSNNMSISQNTIFSEPKLPVVSWREKLLVDKPIADEIHSMDNLSIEEQILSSALSTLKPPTPKPILKSLTSEQEECMSEILHKITKRDIKVYRRIISPTALDYLLQKALFHMHRQVEDKRSPYWKQNMPVLPPCVKTSLREFYYKPPLPESVQIQSRHEYFYKRRIYDERHMLALELRKKSKTRRKAQAKIKHRKQVKCHKKIIQRKKNLSKERQQNRVGLRKKTNATDQLNE